MQTRLDVINDMIVSTGARPLLAGQSNHPMYAKATQLLDRVIGAVLSMGLWFNTEVRIIPTQTNGEIVVPQNCIHADPTDRKYNLTLRNSKMYDLDQGTYYIGTELKLRMFFRLDYEELPLQAKEYIRARATYEFYLGENGANPKLSEYRNERDTGWVILWREHLRNRQMNVFDNPQHAANRMRRGYNNYGWGRR